MLIAVNGLVIREVAYKEHDKILTVLTAERGKLSVYCHGVRSVKNRNMVCCQLFAYSEFILDDRRDMYTLKEASLIENFYKIRENLSAFAFAQYALDAASEASTEEAPEGELLSLMLNTLYLCSKEDADIIKIKAAFELRFVSIVGFCPDISSCSCCQKTDGSMLFDIPNGNILCPDCADKALAALKDGETLSLIPLSASVIAAMRYIVSAPDKRVYSFSLPEEEMRLLGAVSEKFLLFSLERSFYSLDFYKSVSQ